MNRKLHIVCLDAPSPPNYGGAIDMHYKVRALAALGFRIALHYFAYRPGRNADGLAELCSSVHVYKRKSFLQSRPFRLPFIVSSRINEDLFRRLNGDAAPVLLEGLHCAGLLPFLNDRSRVVLRMHNDEAAYYRHLAKSETAPLKKLYFQIEGSRLARFQRKMVNDVHLACLSQTDRETFQTTYGFSRTHFVPCFLPWQTVNAKPGRGNYCLYHGNMRISENEAAALWLAQRVFSQTEIPLVIAGSGITERLAKKVAGFKNIRLINNPTVEDLQSLVQNAHVNVLPSVNNTGVKLKLLNALFNGRFCYTNSAGVKGSNINAGLVVEDDASAWRQRLTETMDLAFTEADRKERQPVAAAYSNAANAELLSALW